MTSRVSTAAFSGSPTGLPTAWKTDLQQLGDDADCFELSVVDAPPGRHEAGLPVMRAFCAYHA
jgi:hypothetical protein